MPKGLHRAAGLRWILLSAAALLTVVAGLLGWIEVADDSAPAPRAFVWGTAMVVWIGFISLCCMVFHLKRQAIRDARNRKEAERNTQRILAAIVERRLTSLADLLEEDVRSDLNEKR
jgi:heme A synthase